MKLTTGGHSSKTDDCLCAPNEDFVLFLNRILWCQFHQLFTQNLSGHLFVVAVWICTILGGINVISRFR